jgi:hypothetical protein
VINSFTTEQIILVGVGIAVIALNRLFAKSFIWWEQNVIKINTEINPWVYRIFIIGIGGLFLSIAYLK